MNSKGLARGYGALSAAERFALAVAASARGDEVELVRLRGAARPLTVTVNDMFGYVTAFTEVARRHWAARLHVAALFFRLLHLTERPGRDREKAWPALRVAAYLLRTYAEGWDLFCRRAGLDPAGGAAGEEWETIVLQAEAEAATLGATEAEAVALVDDMHGSGATPAESQAKTRETVAEDLREQFLERLSHWGVR